MDYNTYVGGIHLSDHEVSLVWLGQAGFLLKTHKNKKVLIDPYLSDYVNRTLGKKMGAGYRRMSASVFPADEITADLIFCSHEHGDHLDIDSLPKMLKEQTVCYTTSASIEKAIHEGVDAAKMKPLETGQTIDCGEFALTATECDHGSSSPTAIGFLLDFGFVQIYFSGDTCLNISKLAEIIKQKPQIALLPINGAYGNINAEEASLYASLLSAKVCIPCHFWTFPAHNGKKGTPYDALHYFQVNAKECELLLAEPGRAIVIGEDGKVSELKY